MIFVTVGTHDQGFDRLVKAADELASQVTEKVIIQRGCSTYQPVHAEHFRYAPSWQIDELMKEADVIVSQASAGTIIYALELKKPLIVAPRLKCFGENWNDHQVELAKALNAHGKVIAIDDLSAEALRNAIEQVRKLPKIEIASSERFRLIQALRNQLKQWEQNSGR